MQRKLVHVYSPPCKLAVIAYGQGGRAIRDLLEITGCQLK